MRVIFQRAELLSALNLAAGVIKARTPKPVLACVKLAASENNSVSVFATDLEMGLACTLHTLQVEQQGEIAIPAEELRSILAACDCDTIKAEADDRGGASILTDSDAFKLYVLSAKDFPPVPSKIDGDGFVLSCEQAADAINRSRGAVNEIYVPKTNGSIQFPKGLMLKAGNNQIDFVGSDGGWMALSSVSAPVDGDISAIIAPRTVAVILKLIEDAEKDSEIRFQFTENQIGVTVGNSFLCAALVEGRLIPYRSVIPTGSLHKATVGAEVFSSSLKRASLLTTELSTGARMDFTRAGLTISATTPDKGSLTVKVPMRFEGADLSIGLKPKQLGMAVRSVSRGGDEITMEMTAANRPVLMKAGGKSLCVLMPCEIQ